MNEERTNDDLHQRLLSWLELTGYPLEMRVAREFYRCEDMRDPWEIQPNYHYYDTESEQYREADLIASWAYELEALAWWLALAIECKNTSQPWVILKDEMNPFNDNTPLFNPGTWRDSIYSNEDHLRSWNIRNSLKDFLKQHCPVYGYPGYSITEGFRRSSDRDAAFNAVRQVVSAARHYSESIGIEESDSLEIVVAAPVVVTTSQIFEAKLDSTSGNLRISEVGRSAVQAHTPFEMVVTVVNIEHLHTVLRDCVATAGAVLEFMRNPEH